MKVIKILMTIAYGLFCNTGLLYSIKACTDSAFGCVGPNKKGTSYAPNEKAKMIIKEEKTDGKISGNSTWKNTCLLFAPRL